MEAASLPVMSRRRLQQRQNLERGGSDRSQAISAADDALGQAAIVN